MICPTSTGVISSYVWMVSSVAGFTAWSAIVYPPLSCWRLAQGKAPPSALAYRRDIVRRVTGEEGACLPVILTEQRAAVIRYISMMFVGTLEAKYALYNTTVLAVWLASR